MKQVTTYVGIDAHKKDLFIAMLVGHQTAPVKLERDTPGAVRVCYEAGPGGYALQR